MQPVFRRIVATLSHPTIEAREKPVVKEKKPELQTTEKKIQKRRGRPKKGEELPQKELTRIEKQKTMTLDEMLKDLPMKCDIGTKTEVPRYFVQKSILTS